MRIENNFLFAVTGFLLFSSSAAIAGAAPEMSQTLALEKLIQKSTEQKIAAETKKYTQIVALAGDRQDELTKRKNEVLSTYKAWQDSKSAVEQSNANADGFRAVEIAAQAYSQANKAFINLQKDILAKNGVLPGTENTFIAKASAFDPVSSFNAAPSTAAGKR